MYLRLVRPTAPAFVPLLLATLFLGCAAGGQYSNDRRVPEGDADGGVGGASDFGDAEDPRTDGTASANTCAAIEVNADPAKVAVHILLDASESMREYDRWYQAKEAVRSVTGTLESVLQFGLRVFPKGTVQPICDSGALLVAPELNTASRISNALSAHGNALGGTPTTQVLMNARSDLSALSSEFAKAVLLVTDGQPNCNPSAPPCGCNILGQCTETYRCDDTSNAVNAVADLRRSGIKTYVVGIQPTSTMASTLDRMAAEGGTGLNQHITVNDPTRLVNALSDVTRKLVSCDFTLESAPTDLAYVRVQLDGQDIPHTDKAPAGQGWTLDGKTIRLLGSACDTFGDGTDHKVSVTLECDPVELI